MNFSNMQESFRSIGDRERFYDNLNYDYTIQNVIMYLWNNDFNKDWQADVNAKVVFDNIMQLRKKFARNKVVYIVWLAMPNSVDWKNVKEKEYVRKTNDLLRVHADANGYFFVEDLIWPNAKELAIKEWDIHPSYAQPYEQLFKILFDQIH